MILVLRDGRLSTRARAEFVLWLFVPPLLTLMWIKLGSIPSDNPLRWLPLAIVTITLVFRLYSISAIMRVGQPIRFVLCLLSSTVAGIAWYYLVVFLAIYWQIVWMWFDHDIGF